MDKKAWQGVIERAAELPAHISDRAAIQAVEEFERRGSLGTPGEVQACLARALEIENQSFVASEDGGLEEALDPTVDLQAGEAFDALKESAAELRKVLFGNPAPPFQGLDEAGKWIRKEKEKAGSRELDREKFERLYGAANQACIELGEYLDVNLTLDVRSRVLNYYEEPNRGQDRAVIRREGVFRSDRRLWQLQSFVASAHKETGLHEADVVALVLTGLAPKRKILVEWAELSFPPKCLQTTITIPKRFPVWADLRAAYQVIQEARERRRLLDETGSCLIDAIRRLGGLPAKGKMKFWRDVAELVREYLGDASFTDKAARMRYGRLPASIRAELVAPLDGDEPGT